MAAGGSFNEFCFWVYFETALRFGFGAEPVEWLRERNCSDRIRLALWPLSQFRLVLRLNCQKDFDTGCFASSSSYSMDKNSINLFFSVSSMTLLLVLLVIVPDLVGKTLVLE